MDVAEITDAVWLDVLPSMDKFGPALGKGAEAEADKVGKGVGRKFGLAVGLGVAAVAGGVVLAGKALYDLGATFDDVSDTIRAGTGATGENLDSLVASAKNIGATVPAEFGAIGTVVADVNTRLGLTGETLELFASQALEAGRVLGEEVDINAVSGAFSAFQIKGEDTTKAMDHLFRVSQATGVGMNELANNAAKSAPALQALGFSFEETTALVGNLDKAGMDSNKMMAGMSKALVELAKDGEEPQEAFKRVTGEVQGFLDKGDKASAIDLASKLFGTRNASQFIGALESGALQMENLGEVAGMTEDTILGVGQETMDFSEQWQIFGNRMSTLVAPIAEKVFGLIGDGMAWINDNAIPYVEKFMASWESGTGPLGDVQAAFQNAWDFLSANVLPILQDLGEFIITQLVPFLGDLVGMILDKVVPVALTMWDVFNAKVVPVLQAVAQFIVDKVIPSVKNLWERVQPAFQNISTLGKEVFEGVILPVLKLVWDFIVNVLGPAFSWLWTNVVDPVMGWIGDRIVAGSDTALKAFRGIRDFIVNTLIPGFTDFGDGVKSVFEGLKSAIAVPVNFIIDTIWNNGLRKALNLIPGVDLGRANTISIPPPPRGGGGGRGNAAYYSGGYTGDGPWHVPAGTVHAGEYVLTAEEVRRLGGPQAVEAWKHSLPGYAGGGLVTWRGHRFTELFAANLAAAEAAARQRFRITQGGFRPTTSYSGTSHKADAVDIARPYSVATIAALRRYGIAAWDRAGKGNWIDHIHGVPTPGAGRAGGSAIWQAQDYLRGGDGLGGRDNGPRVGGGGLDLFAIPKMIKDVMAQVRDGLKGSWGSLLKDGVLSVIGNVKDWAMGKLNEWGDSLGRLIFGGADRGYQGGTGWAQPGLAHLGELGSPELVLGPTTRMMSGGERVFSSRETRALLRGNGGVGSLVTAEAIADALIQAGFPEKVRDGVAQGLNSRGRAFQVEAMDEG